MVTAKTPFSRSDRDRTSNLVKLAGFLIALYVQRRFFPTKKYEYNDDYLPPLALTNVPESRFFEKVFGIALPNLPEGAFPSLVWVIKVILRLIILTINNYLIQHNTVNRTSTRFQTLQQNLDEMKNQAKGLNWDLEDRGNQENLTVLVQQLETTLANIVKDLDLDTQLRLARKEHPSDDENLCFEKLIKQAFLEGENWLNQYLSDYKFSKKQEHLFQESVLIQSLQKTIGYAAKLAELTDLQGEVVADTIPTLHDYNQLYQIIRKPAIANVFQEDLIFAYLQVAGANPLVLEAYTQTSTRLPVSEEQYQAIAAKYGVTDSLPQALGEGRLFIADYQVLEGLVSGNYVSQEVTQQKYVTAPIALFAVPPKTSTNRSLFPVAISYRPSVMSDHACLVTPLESNEQGEPWMTAKNIVQMADCNYHELISHLGRTHLIVEVFIVPTYHLPMGHPVRTLLIPHFEGTVLINYGAHAFLVAPGGSVDSLLAASVGADQSLAAWGTQSYLFDFNAIQFPKTLRNRGVNNPDTLPIYPYREDGQLIWEAIHTWVTDYIQIYYENDQAVAMDSSLQTWGETLISLQGGRLQNFGENEQGHLLTKAYLAEVLATVIFTASAQHAAVNFAQKALMMYVPGFPLARYQKPPVDPQPRDNFMAGLPSLSQAQNQINILYLLGSVYFTTLGDYPAGTFPNNAQLNTALQRFQAHLQTATETITLRNQSRDRLFPYEFLLPPNIPQSINI